LGEFHQIVNADCFLGFEEFCDMFVIFKV